MVVLFSQVNRKVPIGGRKVIIARQLIGEQDEAFVSCDGNNF